MYKVSVIVPIYNAEKDLEKTICNIQKQSLRDIEIICVNDGSEDRSGEIIKHFQKKILGLNISFNPIKVQELLEIWELTMQRESILHF